MIRWTQQPQPQALVTALRQDADRSRPQVHWAAGAAAAAARASGMGMARRGSGGSVCGSRLPAGADSGQSVVGKGWHQQALNVVEK